MPASLTRTQCLMLYALSKFYARLNQPLVEKPLQVRTSKAVFIRLILQSKVFSKQERAIYRNLEILEEKKCLIYENHMIIFTEKGLRELHKIEAEISKFLELSKKFQQQETKGNFQTIIRN